MTEAPMQNGGQDDLTNAFDSVDAGAVRMRGMLASRLEFPVRLMCIRIHQREENG